MISLNETNKWIFSWLWDCQKLCFNKRRCDRVLFIYSSFYWFVEQFYYVILQNFSVYEIVRKINITNTQIKLNIVFCQWFCCFRSGCRCFLCDKNTVEFISLLHDAFYWNKRRIKIVLKRRKQCQTSWI